MTGDVAAIIHAHGDGLTAMRGRALPDAVVVLLDLANSAITIGLQAALGLALGKLFAPRPRTVRWGGADALDPQVEEQLGSDWIDHRQINWPAQRSWV
ncbi:hypothetical protein DK26_01375 [Bosea sp. WAO]|nr:hypothetical protein DK26_01375 [Bosea sp. WAO]